MILVTFILRRYNSELQTSEMFNTAGRTVKSGLVGSAVVSSWTWAATLLQSTGVCYRYGVSGPFWYASGATVQILLFATLAIELKRRAPNAHTFLEVIKARYGTVPHLVFTTFGLVTNILVSLMLIVGGSATVNALTGMHTVAAIYLLPVGVVGNYVFLRRTPCSCAHGFGLIIRHSIHHGGRSQGYHFDRLDPHLHLAHHYHHLLPDSLRVIGPTRFSISRLRSPRSSGTGLSSRRKQGRQLSGRFWPPL